MHEPIHRAIEFAEVRQCRIQEGAESPDRGVYRGIPVEVSHDGAFDPARDRTADRKLRDTDKWTFKAFDPKTDELLFEEKDRTEFGHRLAQAAIDHQRGFRPSTGPIFGNKPAEAEEAQPTPAEGGEKPAELTAEERERIAAQQQAEQTAA